MDAGGALFVNGATNVTLVSVTFASNQALGGTNHPFGGGGGLGGNGMVNVTSGGGGGGDTSGGSGGGYARGNGTSIQSGIGGFGGRGSGANPSVNAPIDGGAVVGGNNYELVSAGGGNGGSGGAYGFGGCGASGNGGYINSGGGAGFGGAIFVVNSGVLTIQGNTSVSGGAVTLGASGGTGTGVVSAADAGLFLQDTGRLAFAPAIGETQTIAEAIIDELGSAIPNPFGTVAPGIGENPTGVLRVFGNLFMERGVLTWFHADGVGNSSRLLVTSPLASGQAFLSGVARIDFSVSPAPGTPHILMNAGIMGTFSGFDSNMPTVDGHLNYSAPQVTFTVTAHDAIFHDGFDIPQVSDSPCVAAFAI